MSHSLNFFQVFHFLYKQLSTKLVRMHLSSLTPCKTFLRHYKWTREIWVKFSSSRNFSQEHRNNYSGIRQKGESQKGCYKKTMHAKCFEKQIFITSWYVIVRVSIRGKEILFIRKFGMLCFLVTPVLRFVLLLNYGQIEIMDAATRSCFVKKVLLKMQVYNLQLSLKWGFGAGVFLQVFF